MPDLPELSHTHALFLDFDGTLAPIVERPDLAALPEEVRPALTRINESLEGALAIVSGREIQDLERLLVPFAPAMAGGHGAALRLPDGRAINPSATALGLSKDALASLESWANGHDGLLVERKARGAALHYRARPDLEKQCRVTMETVLAEHPGRRLIAGKMVFEIAPAAETKGHALAQLMRAPPFEGRSPVAVGDDVTDEDLFRAAQAHGGDAIKVGAGPTAARYRVDGPSAVWAWLAREADRLAGKSARGEARGNDA